MTLRGVVSAATLSALCIACAPLRDDESREREVEDLAAETRAVALRQDNTLILLSARGVALREVKLAARPPSSRQGRYLAWVSPDRLVVVSTGSERDTLSFVALTGEVMRRVLLPQGVRVRAVAVAPDDRAYLAGEVASGRNTAVGTSAHNAVLLIVRPGTPLVTSFRLRTVPRTGNVPDWGVHDIALSTDGRRVYVSYHGANTEGVDYVDVDGLTPRRCRGGRALAGCIDEIHGGIVSDEANLLAALGTPPLLAQFDAEGRRRQSWDSGLGSNAHLMEFAVRGRRVYTIESCAKTGGMTRIDLVRSQTQVLHRPAAASLPNGLPARTVCGERISAGRGDQIVVMKRGTVTGVGGVMILDGEGRLQRWLPLDPAPTDVLARP